MAVSSYHPQKDRTKSGFVDPVLIGVRRRNKIPCFRCPCFLRFVDGTAGEVDLSRLVLGDKAGVFAALLAPTLFATAFVEYGAVVWPGEIDLAPDAMTAR
jgi:hypothetical protein